MSSVRATKLKLYQPRIIPLSLQICNMNEDRKVRVRFAPSPTGPLHIGGVRTALYNFLFARKHHGAFILRIEDTDQTRYVPGAEDYIIDALEWLGLSPDESVTKGGHLGPYRQSERKEIYKRHVDQLIQSGNAYYAFDTQEDLEKMRLREKEKGNHTPKYDQKIRMQMRNSLTLPENEVDELLKKGENITVRMKVPENEVITFSDIVRGDVSFQTNELDDKVILKADGLPTYHMANIVDDHLMQISHVIRGEEWLSSTAHHVMLYQFFNWKESMPLFAHLPLILKPSGKGKLSKRDGAKFGFPVFPLEWNDEKDQSTYSGFRQEGFLPSALLNFLVLLGWNPGTDEEIFDLDQLTQIFDLDRINKSGAQFNFEKAIWFNQQYIVSTPPEEIYELVKTDFVNQKKGLVKRIIKLLQPRVESLSDFVKSSEYFFSPPSQYDEKGLRKKYKSDNESHFIHLAKQLAAEPLEREAIEVLIKGYISSNNLGFGAILPVLRIFIAGSMSGPDLFEMIEVIGTSECADRIKRGVQYIKTIDQ